MTGVTRCFLGNSSDPAAAVARSLLRECALPGTSDLGGCLVILPGRQAIRAVSVELTRENKLILPPDFVTAGVFFRMGEAPDIPVASRPEQEALWLDILENLDADEVPRLFPDGPDREEASAFFHADQIIRLRRELEQSGRAGSLRAAAAILAEEDGRWNELAALEERFLARLSESGLADPSGAARRTARSPEPFRKYRKIVLAAVPDLAPAIRAKLDFLKHAFETDDESGPGGPDFLICIAAPGSDAPFFDEWGCVIPEKWSERSIPLPSEPDRLHSVQDPREMAELAARLAPDTETGVFDMDSTALVVTDASLAQEMRKSFSRFKTREGTPLEVYDPNGVAMKNLRVCGILSALRELIRADRPSADAFRRLLEQECFAQRIARLAGMTEDELRSAADAFFLIRLPDEISESNRPDPALVRSSAEKERMTRLETAFRKIEDMRTRLKGSKAPVSELGGLLGEIFSEKRYPPRFGIELDAEAQAFRETAVLFEKSPLLRPLPADRQLLLLQNTLDELRLYPEHDKNALEITGFLDSLFLPADRIILCGMNEGLLPETLPPSPFLNESIRKKLALPDNASRFARDAFYLTSLLARTGGNIQFLACKRNRDGTPLRFSSFFFRGVDDLKVLLDRTETLFADYPVSSAPAEDSRELPFHAGTDLTKAFGGPDQIVLNVTDFKQILNSPLQAFFSRVLNMEEEDYNVRELDPAVLGTVIHSAFQRFYPSDSWRSALTSGSEAEKTRALNEAVDAFHRLFLREVRGRVGENMPLLPMIQTELWLPRIRAAVRELLLHSASEVLEREWALADGQGIPVEGVLIKGKIDRIEYDRALNTLRIIDFKSGRDGAKKAHVNSARFFDLQLPLYKMLLPLDPVFRKNHPDIDLENCRILCGYFRISSVTADIGYDFWDDMDRYDDAAEKLVRQIIQTVKDMRSGILRENLNASAKSDFFKKLFPRGLTDTLVPSFTLEAPFDPPEMPKENRKKAEK